MSGEDAAAGGRYRVVRTLGQGGMGTVHEAVELSSSRKLALKRLRTPHPAAAERSARLFQQEFHTLSHLGHPRVVEVYDYGRDEDGEYYTMELLDGGDLRALAPLPWRRVCALLCDVCSALSMLHSRRLVHRDLSPRNIRCTADGKAKLIDFGAMAPFGPSRHVVGTPPSTAPETLLGQGLDARTDLFAVGAAAYYGLTKRHAYPASSFRALRSAWRTRPAPPSRYASDVPRELDELVLGLLQLSPLARPSNAAEVIERLCAVAELTLDEQLPVSRAYLVTPTLVGRDELLAGVRGPLLSALRGTGGALLLSGAPGIGRSRMLDACVLEGKLLGALVLRVNAADAVGSWGGAGALIDGLHEALPMLGEVPEQFVRLSETKERAALQSALRAHFLAACQRQPLVLAVDDLPRLDEPSAAFIALLADAAFDHPLFVVATAEADVGVVEDGRLGLFAMAARRIELAPLTLDESDRLLRSIFGDVPNVSLLADRLHAVAAGNPRALMQLAQHLLDRGVLSYEAGTWTLPGSFDPDDIPASIGDALRQRFARLGAGAQRLARALALSAEPSLSFEQCLSLSESGETGQVLADIDELVAAEIIGTDGERYGLSQPAWRSAVLAELPDAEARQLHVALFEILASSGREPVALRHAVLGGDLERARSTMLAFYERIHELYDNDIDQLTAFVGSLPEDYIRTLEPLVALCRDSGRSRREYQDLLMHMIGVATLRAELNSGMLGEALELLYQDSGLSDHAALEDVSDPAERLQRALTAAQQRFEAAPEPMRGLSPFEAIRALARLTLSCIAYTARSYDLAFLKAVPTLAPLAPLSPALSIVELDRVVTCHLGAARIGEARTGYLELLRRLDAPDLGMVTADHTHLVLSVRFALGSLDAAVGRESVLEWADAVAHHPMFAASAERLRLQYALSQGDTERCALHRRELERLKTQNCPPQQFEGTHMFLEVAYSSQAEDLVSLKQLLPPIERTAREVVTWRPLWSFAQARYHLLRGDARAAVAELEPALDGTGAGEHLVWPLLAGTHVTALIAIGAATRAVAAGRGYLAAAEAVGLHHREPSILCPLALAEAELGEYGDAVAHAERAIAIHEQIGATGIDPGAAHEARARVAIAMRDEQAFERYATSCAILYRVGYNSSLTAKYERLMRAARDAGLCPNDEVLTATELGEPDTEQLLDRVETALSLCEGPRERADRILSWLNEEGCYFGGFLFTLQHDGPQLSAQDCQRQPPAALGDRIAAHVANEVDGAGAVLVSVDSSGGDASETDAQDAPTWLGADGARFVPLTLSHESEAGLAITGVAVMCIGSATTLDPPDALLHAISTMLHENGDVVTRVCGD